MFQRQFLAAFLLPFGCEPVARFGGIELAEIVQMQAMLRAAGADGLLAIGRDAQAQHRVMQVKGGNGLSQSFDVQVAAVKFRIQVGGYAPQRRFGLPTYPVGGLHRGQRFHRVSISIERL
ncbi:hypothetical protein D3C71_1521060 [compost metagenome]